jgi:hypothetical protein
MSTATRRWPLASWERRAPLRTKGTANRPPQPHHHRDGVVVADAALLFLRSLP